MVSRFRQTLLRWYRTHGRNLPWRYTHDPYRILIAEMMLQQTQVDRVIERYQRWLQRFPTIRHLAKASTGDVLREWSGLGYNRRALAVHGSAKKIMNEYGGKFPRDVQTLQSCKGIGKYTAHAIAVFAFQKQVPLVDTNIRRVLGRIFLGYKKMERLREHDEVFWKLSQQQVACSSNVYELNQGLMDLGATICTAKQPRCQRCPVRTLCTSYPAILKAKPDQLRVKVKRVEPKYFGQPRRIWRGRILQLLHQHTTGLTVTAIGKQLQPDWEQSRQAWLQTVIATLVQDKMVEVNGRTVTIKV